MPRRGIWDAQFKSVVYINSLRSLQRHTSIISSTVVRFSYRIYCRLAVQAPPTRTRREVQSSFGNRCVGLAVCPRTPRGPAQRRYNIAWRWRLSSETETSGRGVLRHEDNVFGCGGLNMGRQERKPQPRATRHGEDTKQHEHSTQATNHTWIALLTVMVCFFLQNCS